MSNNKTEMNVLAETIYYAIRLFLSREMDVQIPKELDKKAISEIEFAMKKLDLLRTL